MSRDNSAVTEVIIDKTIVDLILPQLSDKPTCESCGKKVTRNSFGGAMTIGNKLTIWHYSFVCLMDFIKAREHGGDNQKEKEA